jgi:hypothetical protein
MERGRILAKIADYEHSNLHLRHALDELHLVCRYSEHALLADLAPETSRFDFAAFALRVGRALADEHGVFNRIFLFNPYEAQKVLQVYPSRLARRRQSTSQSQKFNTLTVLISCVFTSSCGLAENSTDLTTETFFVKLALAKGEC